MDSSNILFKEIKIIKGNINTKDDFFEHIEKNKKIDYEKKENFDTIILIKNYLTSPEVDKIFSVNSKIYYCVNCLTKLNL